MVHHGDALPGPHCSSRKEVSVDKGKVQALVALKVPRDCGELASFLGAVVFYARFIPDFAVIAQPLRELRRKWKGGTAAIRGTHHWTSKHQKSYDALKAALSMAPVLAFPDFTRPWILLTDASYGQIACCLAQLDKDGVERPVAYASRELTNTEKRYGNTDKEALAVVFATKKFRVYIDRHDAAMAPKVQKQVRAGA